MANYQAIREVNVQLKETGKTAHTGCDVISKYNFFIEQYNSDENREADIYLSTIRGACFYRFFCSRLPILCILQIICIPLILLFNPGQFPDMGYMQVVFLIVIIVIFVLDVIGLFIYEHGRSVFRRNEQKVNNPFKNMIFAPALCGGFVNQYYELQIFGNF